ncbi:MAG: hypothetical protein RLY70_3837 [Planctomycetota bacterium]
MSKREIRLNRRAYLRSTTLRVATTTLAASNVLRSPVKVWSQSGSPPGSTAAEQGPELAPAAAAAVRRGVGWLLRALPREGGWGTDIGQPPDIGCTALSGLALLSTGNTPREGPQARETRRALSYLLECAARMPADDITASLQTQLQNKIGRHAHSFLAALFLSQVAGETLEGVQVRRALRRVLDAIVAAQTTEGHWGQTSWAPTLGTVMGWVALRAAHFAGLRVGASPETTASFLARQMQASLGGGGAGAGWMHTLYKNATGIRVLYALGQETTPVARQAIAETLKLVTSDNTAFTQAGGEEFLAFHLITETLSQRGGPDWNAWYGVVRDKIVAVQNEDGSWSGAHCITSRVFCTAAALLVLNAPRRYLPISQV